MNVRAWAAGLVVVFLAACGGGGGSSQPAVSVSAVPTTAVLAGTTTGAAPSTSIELSATNVPDAGLYVLVSGSSQGYVSATFDGEQDVVITGVNPASLAARTYQDSVSVKVCYDSQCSRQVNNSPLTIPVTYTVTQGDPATATPAIVNTSPASVVAGSLGFTMTVSGVNFAPSSVLMWNGQARATTYVSSNTLTVLINASDVSSITSASISVSNAQTGGGVSAPQVFQITAPVPVVAALSPASAATGGSAFVVTVTGTGFDSSARVTWNGSARVTNFASATRLTAQIAAADIAVAGTFPVGVYNADGGSVASNTMPVTVADAPLAVSSLAPPFVAAGGPAYFQTVFGTGFGAASTVQWNGSPRTTTFVSTTELKAQVSAADIASVGTAAIKVVNGGANPATSGTLTLTLGLPSTDATAYQINPQHSGAIRFASILGSTALSSAPSWTAQLDGSAGYPLIAGGRVFVTVTRSSGSGSELVALSAATGAVVWGPIAIAGSASATYDSGRVIVMSSGGVMTGFDAASGNQLWSALMPGQWSFTAPPTAANGIAYTGGAGDGGTLYAVDDTTGALLWTAGVMNGDASSPTVTADGVYVTYPCQTYDFQPQTGLPVWHDRRPVRRRRRCDGRVCERRLLFAQRGGLAAARPSMPRRATCCLPMAAASPALGAAMGYFMQSGTLDAIDLSSNTIRWTFAGDGAVATSPLLVNNYVFVGSSSGKLYALDATSGATVWQTSLAGQAGSGAWMSLSQSGMSAGDGLLLVPVGSTLVAYTLSNAP